MRRIDSLEKTDARRDWGQEEMGTTEDEMAGWHHWLDGHESEWIPGVGDGQGGLECCSPWGHRIRHNWVTEQLVQFSSIQSLSSVRLFETPWIAARQASLSITNSRSSLKLMSIKSVIPSSHLILCRPLFLLPPIPPSISLFQWVSSWHQVAKVLEFQVQNSALNVPAHLENSAQASGLENISFDSNLKERQCQRMVKLKHSCCTHLSCQ